MKKPSITFNTIFISASIVGIVLGGSWLMKTLAARRYEDLEAAIVVSGYGQDLLEDHYREHGQYPEEIGEFRDALVNSPYGDLPSFYNPFGGNVRYTPKEKNQAYVVHLEKPTWNPFFHQWVNVLDTRPDSLTGFFSEEQIKEIMRRKQKSVEEE